MIIHVCISYEMTRWDTRNPIPKGTSFPVTADSLRDAYRQAYRTLRKADPPEEQIALLPEVTFSQDQSLQLYLDTNDFPIPGKHDHLAG